MEVFNTVLLTFAGLLLIVSCGFYIYETVQAIRCKREILKLERKMKEKQINELKFIKEQNKEILQSINYGKSFTYKSTESTQEKSKENR